MKLFFTSMLCCLISLSTWAQTTNQTSTLQVVGNAKMYVKPDLGVLIIHVTHKDQAFGNAIVGLNKKTQELHKQLLNMGFKEEEIKTNDFQINENKVYYHDRYIDSGYIASHNLQVEFKYEKETITKILNTFSKSKTDFSIQFNFKLSDALKSKVENELIVMAIQDAKKKSKLIASTSEVTLKKIKTIQYGSAYSSGVSELHEMRFLKADAVNAPNETMMGFTPNDILFEDNLSIIWDIE